MIYLGYGRYGQVNDKSAEGSNKSKNYIVTHIVKNGLLQQVEHNPDTEEDHFSNQYKSLYKKRKIKVDPKALEALSAYVKNGEHQIVNNMIMSKTDKHANNDIKNRMKSLDSLFMLPESSLNDDTVLYKGVYMKEIKKGQEIQYRGYMSTTMDNKIASSFIGTTNDDTGEHIMLEINAKKGVKAIDVDSLLDTKEREFIFPKDTVLKIVDGPIYSKKGQIWQAEIEPEEDEKDAINKTPSKSKEKK